MSAVEKLEKPTRVRELQIGRVLDCLTISGERSFCDIGAGTGLFALEAAARTRGPVYALEVSDEMLALLRERRDAKRLDNIDIRRVEGPLPLDDASCDRCLLSTVYHELDDRQAMLREIVDDPAFVLHGNHPVRLFIGSGMPTGLWNRVTEAFAPAHVVEFFATTDGQAVLANVSGAKIGSKGRPLPGAGRIELGAYDAERDLILEKSNSNLYRGLSMLIVQACKESALLAKELKGADGACSGCETRCPAPSCNA